MVPEANERFMVYAKVQLDNYGWSFSRALRHAKQLAPEVFFAELDVDTARHWKTPPPKETRGRVPRLLPLPLLNYLR